MKNITATVLFLIAIGLIIVVSIATPNTPAIMVTTGEEFDRTRQLLGIDFQGESIAEKIVYEGVLNGKKVHLLDLRRAIPGADVPTKLVNAIQLTRKLRCSVGWWNGSQLEWVPFTRWDNLKLYFSNSP